MKKHIKSSTFLIFTILLFSLSTCKVGDDEVIVVSEGTEDSVDMSRYFSGSQVYVYYYKSDGSMTT